MTAALQHPDTRRAELERLLYDALKRHPVKKQAWPLRYLRWCDDRGITGDQFIYNEQNIKVFVHWQATYGTDEQQIDQAKNYAVAIGRDPAKIRNIDDAQKLMGSMADDCAKYGCD